MAGIQSFSMESCMLKVRSHLRGALRNALQCRAAPRAATQLVRYEN